MSKMVDGGPHVGANRLADDPIGVSRSNEPLDVRSDPVGYGTNVFDSGPRPVWIAFTVALTAPQRVCPMTTRPTSMVWAPGENSRASSYSSPKVEGDRRSPSDRPLGPDAAAMAIDHARDRRQADSRSRKL